MLIIDDLLLLPGQLFLTVIEKIRDMALEELEDTPEKLKRELLDLQMSFEIGEIKEAEYQKKEDEILERLNALKNNR